MKKFLSIAAMTLFCASSLAQNVEKILAGMTTREKVAQLFVCTLSSKHSDVKRHQQQIEWAKEGIGGFIVMDGHLAPFIEDINELQGYAKIPLMVSIDGEWGPSMRFSEFPYFPKQMQLGALPDSKLVYKMGRAVGKELRLIKIGINYAPVVDVNCNPKNPVINTRSFGEDREKVAEYGIAYALGMQAEKVSACAKHFPGHGDTDTDSHRALPVINFDRNRLDSLELYPFRRCISKGIDMIMLAHLNVPALDNSGTPSSISKPIVTDLLRNELGFNGLIVTDALGMDGVYTYFGSGPLTCLATFKAGADMLLMPVDVIGSINLIVSKVEEGEISMEDLDNRVRKILTQKAFQGMLSDKYVRTVDMDKISGKLECKADKKLIAEISRKSIVTVVKPEGKILEGKVAYLALGAGAEKKVPTMDEDDPNIPREGGKGGPEDYGSRRGIGKSGAEEMAAIFGKYAKADCFSLPRNFSAMDLVKIREQLKDYNTVILGFHDTDSRPQRNYGIKDPAIYDFIGKWASEKEQELVGIYFGSPYALDVMPWFKDFRAFFIGWADNIYNCNAAAKIVCGKQKSYGSLPVSAGGLPCGYKAD